MVVVGAPGMVMAVIDGSNPITTVPFEMGCSGEGDWRVVGCLLRSV